MAAARDIRSGNRDGYGWGVDSEEISRFFLEYEATVGFRSTFSAMIAASEGVALGSGSPAGWDPYASVIGSITDGKRVYRRLRAMEESGHLREVVILWRLYGPKNGHSDKSGDFGNDRLATDASALVALTEAARNARDEFVLRESSARAERTSKAVSASRQVTLDELEPIFWREVGAIAKAEAAVIRLDEIPGAQDRADKHARRYEAGWSLLGQIIEAISFDGTIRARTSTIVSVDREVTVEDAIREILDSPRRKHRNKEAAQAAKEAKAAFVTAVRLEAHRMRRDAHDAYREASRVVA